jgi:hypothetical protein
LAQRSPRRSAAPGKPGFDALAGPASPLSGLLARVPAGVSRSALVRHDRSGTTTGRDAAGAWIAFGPRVFSALGRATQALVAAAAHEAAAGRAAWEDAFPQQGG